MREFAGIDLGEEPVPDETTVCKFRHLLEQNNFTEQLFISGNQYLSNQGIKVGSGKIVDTTIISAPSSTKKINKGSPN